MEGVFTQDEEQEPLDMAAESESDGEQQEFDMEDEDAEEDEHLPVCESSFESSDEFSDTEEGETTVSEGWTSRSGDIQWTPTNIHTQPYTPAPTRMEPGPTRYATARISSVVDSFNLYMTDDILKLIVDHTNLQGKRTVRGWRNIDIIDLRAYMGVVLLAGVYQSHNEPTSSLWDDHTGRAIFRTTMSQKTFRLINTCLRFEDRQSRSPHMRRDKLAALRDLWEMWNARLPVLYNPGNNVCVDELLIPFQGRCFFRQFHPKNPAKLGLKVWVTCDVDTCYAWRMSVDTRQQAGAGTDRNQGRKVVLDMTEGLRGVTVTCDSLVSSFALGEELLQRNVALVGNIRHNKPDLPPQLLRAQGRDTYSSVFAFTRTHTAVSYVPRRGKNILLISTKHREAAVSSGEKKKPLMICDYNQCKGGVGNLDKVVGPYSCRRRTARWPLVLFFHLLDVSAHNAFILWTTMDPLWQQGKSYPRRLFIEELGKSLVAPQIARRNHPPQTPGGAALAMDARIRKLPRPTTRPKQQKRRRCSLCTSRKQVFTVCTMCGRPVCKEHYHMVCIPCLS